MGRLQNPNDKAAQAQNMEMISTLGLKNVWRQHFTMYVTNQK